MFIQLHTIFFFQDPIELVHNISQLLTERSIAILRKTMVVSIASLKRNPDCFTSVLRLEQNTESGLSGMLSFAKEVVAIIKKRIPG